MATEALKTTRIVWDRVRGRNPVDDPATLPDDIAQHVINVRLRAVGLGKKRHGISASMPSAASPDEFDEVLALTSGNLLKNSGAYTRHMIGMDGSVAAQFIRAIDGDATATGQPLPGTDALIGRAQDMYGIEFNGLIYFAYESPVNRLHAFHPDAGMFRTGLPTPVAATVGNTGAGAYAATLRYYRIQWRTVNTNGRTVRSNLGAAVSFTPSGAGTAARVTRPTAPSAADPELETHWAVYASADGANYYDISGSIVLATTTYDDTITPSTYFSGRDAAPPEGTFTPWPSVRFLLNAGERMMGLGVFTSAPASGTTLSIVPGRVFFSPVMNTTDTNDNERISNTTTVKGYIDVAAPRSGIYDRAIAGMINNVALVFLNRGIYALAPTGDAVAPYRRVRLDPIKGAANQASTFVGEDEAGRPCVYFLDPLNGPYRYGDRGFEWLGYEVQDVWRRFNLTATGVSCHGVWDRRTSAAIWWIALDDENWPNHGLVFDAKYGRAERNNEIRGGWSEFTGLAAQARCSCIGFDTNYTSLRAKFDRVIIGMNDGIAPAHLVLFDREGQVDDDPEGSGGTAFAGSITSRAFSRGPDQVTKTVGWIYLQAIARAGASIKTTLIGDFGLKIRDGSAVSLAPGSLTQEIVSKKVATALMSDIVSLQIQLSDVDSEDSGSWQLNRVLASMEALEEA